jgi:transporter family-2 protein
MTYLYIFLALIAGAVLPLQVGVNNMLRHGLGSPILAALISFAVGSVCLLAYAVLVRTPLPSMQEASRLPVWAWLGGALGAYYVAMTIFVAPQLGAANLITLTVTTQLIMSLVLDHYGLIGFVQHSINVWRVSGAILLIVGTLLIVRH